MKSAEARSDFWDIVSSGSSKGRLDTQNKQGEFRSSRFSRRVAASGRRHILNNLNRSAQSSVLKRTRRFGHCHRCDNVHRSGTLGAGDFMKDQSAQIRAALERTRVMSGWPQEAVDEICANAEIKNYSDGEHLHSAGDAVDAVWIVIEGA